MTRNSSGTQWGAQITLGLALHSTSTVWLKSCTLSPLPLRSTQIKWHTWEKLVAAVQYLQLRNGTWNTPCTEHNISRSKLLALLGVAALNSRHQRTAGLFLLWALHQLLSTCPVSLKRQNIVRKEKKMLNKTVLKKNSWFCVGSQVTDICQRGFVLPHPPLMGLEWQR